MERKVHANQNDIKALVDAQLSLYSSDSRIPHIGIYLENKQIKRLAQLGWIELMPDYNRYYQISEVGYAAIKDEMIVASFSLFMRNLGIQYSKDQRIIRSNELRGCLVALGCEPKEVYVFDYGDWYENMQVNFKQFNVSYHSKVKKYAVGIYSFGNNGDTMDVAAFRKELDLAEMACDYMNNVLEGQLALVAAQ